MKLLRRDIVVFENKDGELSEPHLYNFDSSIQTEFDQTVEIPTAQWVLLNNHSAGAGTETMPESHYCYFALRVNERVYGVVGIESANSPMEATEQEMLLSILGETALALENDKNAREKEAAAVLAESEQLRANLLRTISHDLRTPLTAICGASKGP